MCDHPNPVLKAAFRENCLVLCRTCPFSTTTTTSTSGAQPYQWLLYGDASGEYSVSGVDAVFYSSDSTGDEMMRTYTAGGDVDGDGSEDALIGAYYESTNEDESGAAYLLYGPLTTDGDVTMGSTFLGTEQNGYAGYALSAAGDVDDDGYDEAKANRRSDYYFAFFLSCALPSFCLSCAFQG